MPAPAPDPDLVTIVATRTVDRLPLVDGRHVEIPGGPAHYIATALDRLGHPYRLVTGKVARVEVILTQEGERYVIPALPPIALPKRFRCGAAILSPIMREIDTRSLPPCDGLLVVDLQGFVREPLTPSGGPGPPIDLSDLVSRASIVKGSAGELTRLNDRSLAALDGRIVVITHGEAGARIKAQGQEDFVEARVVPAPHTIGAGDMYLAAFVSAMLRGQDPFSAGSKAARFTEMILQERLEAASN